MTHSPLLILESSTLYLPDQICNSPYCQPYNSYDVRSENLVLDQLIIPKLIFFFILITYLFDIVLIAALAERSPIIIQYSSNPSRRKNLDVRPYDRTTVRPYDRTTVRPYKVLLLTCVVNCTAGTPTPRLCSVVQWSVHWAPSRTTRVLVLARARRCALETCGKKKCELSF